MTDLTDLGVAAIRDGVRDGSFSAREVAEGFIANVSAATARSRCRTRWSRSAT